ncbi:OLC1v1026041C1 [Oldenlandia corymbosa var. corymbosa]|uniref:OLC1v1026041C1 n=1 Tax=Oldenlandia corymbosa var. corymbosa TaxID=529605 RepID=A0AAV1C628_OLDCO|nr:OLC1v1026041C1 [Oldenlandia corymbosa var. corymbosa]
MMDFAFNLSSFFLMLYIISSASLVMEYWMRTKSKQINIKNKKKKLPPTPWKLPILGHIHHLLGSPPHRALAKLAQKHGDLMHVKLGEISAIVISSPRLAKQILRTHDLAFADRAALLATKIVCYNGADIASSPYGEFWRQMRKICTQELLSAEKVRSFRSIRLDEASNVVSSVHELAGTGAPVNLTAILGTYSSSMVFRAAFGKTSRHHKDTFLEVLKEALPLVTSFDISDLFPSYKFLHPFSWMRKQFVDVHKKIDGIFDSIIDEHVENRTATQKGMSECSEEDLVDVLLRVKESGSLQIPINNDHVKAVLIDMFSAGTETSSSIVEWALSEMIRNPKVMARARDEIRRELHGKQTVDEDDLCKLRYLKLVIKETLRLHPPGPLLVPRECREECEVDGYIITTKTRVLVNAWAIGRDPEYWKNPECFDPDRFENGSVDYSGTHYEYIPFGAGRRMCPGISFGVANIELPLALLLYHFDWELPHGLNPNDLDMSETTGLAASRKTHLCLMANPYDSSL